MHAIDTNIIVRLLTCDDPVQAKAARSLLQVAREGLESGEIFVGVTVLLETEWVLRAAYGFSADQIASALRRFSGLTGVEIEDAAVVAVALDWMTNGMDFADALHLARARHCSVFLTFDRKLARRAKAMVTVPVAIP